MENDKVTRIRELNDAFRTTGIGGTILMTRGVAELDDALKSKIVSSVASYENFTEDNDPYEEHDFGNFEVEGYMLYWKIDYYDADMIYGSNDASDPEVTTRVLTVMLTSEY